MNERTDAEVFDYYQAAVYNRERLTGAMARLLDQLGTKRVLDCACGTGLPALDLRSMGYAVDCSDGSAEMLEQFRFNAREMRVSDAAWTCEWAALPSLDEHYPLVMCRGNSLAYKESWTAGRKSRDDGSPVEAELHGIASVVSPRGFLLIDAPRCLTLAPQAHKPTTFRGEQIEVREDVQLVNGVRKWTQDVRIGSEHVVRDRESLAFTSRELRRWLRDCGFRTRRVRIDGERNHYDVILARKCRRGAGE